jgi:geranylgeranyl pyrophosphate synthase
MAVLPAYGADARVEPMRLEPARRAAAASNGDDLIAAARRALDAQGLERLLDLASDSVPLELLRRAALEPAAAVLRRPGKRFRARLVELGWRLCAGEAPLPPALPAAIELIHLGSMVVDDIEDGSSHRRGGPAAHRIYGVPLALNTGNLLYFLPLVLLDELALPAARALTLHRRIAHTMVRAHCGQALDLDSRVATVSQAEITSLAQALSALKTGSLMGLAAALGPLCSGAGEAVDAALARFGAELGVALQMCDDAGNLNRHDPHKQYEDLRLGRLTWVWAWLAESLSREEYAGLQRRAAAVEAGRAEAATLAEDLRRLLGVRGRLRARQRRRAAFASLRRQLGDHPELRRFERDCERLEGSYE